MDSYTYLLNFRSLCYNIRTVTTITIPKNLIMEKDLMIIPRLEYQNLLRYTAISGEHEGLWQNASKEKFFRSYKKSDEIYDQI